MNVLHKVTVCLLGSTLLSTPAYSKSINYAAFEELFNEPVTTSANGSPMRRSDVPMDMTIISSADIARYPAREIPDILRHYAGISVRTHAGSSYSVNVRGYNPPASERLLVLVNGRQVYEDFFGVVNWASIPVSLGEIQQIEVVRGPNTALFGFNAVSGVVNIVTKDPLYNDVSYIETDVGTNKYGKVNAAVTHRSDDKWGLRVSGGYSKINEDHDYVIDSSENGLFHDIDKSGDLNLDFSMKLNEDTTVRLETSISDTSQNSITAYLDGATIDEKFVGLKGDISSDTDYGIINFTVYNNRLSSQYQVGGEYGFNNDVVVARLSDTFKLGTEHTFRISGEYRENKNVLSLNGSDFSTSSFYISSLDGLWYWDATPSLSFSSAIRYDHANADLDGSELFGGGLVPGNPFSLAAYNNRYDEFGYNFGALYKLTDNDSLRFNASKGIDMPSLFETSFQLSLPGLGYFPDPTIEVSDVHDFQLGYERKLAGIQGAFKTTVFYQQINEMQNFIANESRSLFILGNVGDSKVFGVELSLNGKAENNIRWGMNYSFSNVSDNTNTDLDFEELNSNHMIKANLGYSPNQQWDLDSFIAYDSNYTGIRDINNVNTNIDINTDIILDMRIAYKPSDDWTVSLNALSLLGDTDQSSYAEKADGLVFFRAKREF